MVIEEGDVDINEDLIPMNAFSTNDVIGIVSYGEIRLGSASFWGVVSL